MNQAATIPMWLRAVPRMSIAVGPILVILGVAYRKPEWAASGGTLILYGSLQLGLWRRRRVEPGSPGDRA